MVCPMRLQPHELPYLMGCVPIAVALARMGLGVWRVHRESELRPGKVTR